MANERNPTLEIRNFGPIEHAELEFGDLTVLVGPQGAGKSLVLQWLKLALDASEIGQTLRETGVDTMGLHAAEAVELYFGEGMSQALHRKTSIRFGGRSLRPESIATKGGFVERGRAWSAPKLFYIPAHRAMLVGDGWALPFNKTTSGMPVVARLFSQAIYEQIARPGVDTLFPLNRVLTKDLRASIDASVFHGSKVVLRQHALRRRRLELEVEEGKPGLPFAVWTAGQREFTPLLLGLYPMLPPRREKKAPGLDWVVIEEPELGLHPRAIATIMVLVIDLLWRGYRVALSTHSPLMLDFVWALRHYKHPKADIKVLGQALGIRTPTTQKKLRAAVDADLRVYYLAHDGKHRVSSEDISSLSPSAESDAESFWGELTLQSSALGAAVSRIPEDV